MNQEAEHRRLDHGVVGDRVRLARRVLAWAHKKRWITTIPTAPTLRKPIRKARDVEPAAPAAALAALPARAGRVLCFIAHGLTPSWFRVLVGCEPGGVVLTTSFGRHWAAFSGWPHASYSFTSAPVALPVRSSSAPTVDIRIS